MWKNIKTVLTLELMLKTIFFCIMRGRFILEGGNSLWIAKDKNVAMDFSFSRINLFTKASLTTESEIVLEF